MKELRILTLEERKQIVSEILLFLDQWNITNEAKERSLQDTIDGVDTELQTRMRRIVIKFLLARNNPMVDTYEVNDVLKEAIKENNTRSTQGIV